MVQLRRGELLFMSLHAPQPRRALRELANSPCPVDRWLHSQLQDLLGWSPQEMLPEEQQELLFTWPGENPGS